MTQNDFGTNEQRLEAMGGVGMGVGFGDGINPVDGNAVGLDPGPTGATDGDAVGVGVTRGGNVGTTSSESHV